MMPLETHGGPSIYLHLHTTYLHSNVQYRILNNSKVAQYLTKYQINKFGPLSKVIDIKYICLENVKSTLYL